MRGAGWRMGAAAAALMLLPGVAAAAPDLRADTDRDGMVDVTGTRDEPGEDAWTMTRGALFLPNLDDDSRRCRIGLTPRQLYDQRLEHAIDRRLAACNDGADEQVNGPEDERDLAPVLLMPDTGVTAGATGRVVLSAPPGRARLFVRRGAEWVPVPADGLALDAGELRAGVHLGLEGRDIIRDNRSWDGVARITVTSGAASDTVVLRVAPVLLQNDLMPAVSLFATAARTGIGPFLTGDPAYRTFARTLRGALRAEGADDVLRLLPVGDRWMQDLFEPAWASVPGPDGPRVMRVLLRTPEQAARAVDLRRTGIRPLVGGPIPRTGLVTTTPGARVVYALRGPDVGVVTWPQRARVDRRMDSGLNEGGNVEALPPHPGHPAGRVVVGSSASRRISGPLLRMLRDQGAQDPLVIDTSWLGVGHVDETIHVVSAPTARGWTIVAADPRLAIRLLRDAARQGGGDAPVFRGRRDSVGAPLATTVTRLLADRRLLADSRTAADRIDGQLTTLMDATGLTRQEIVRVPVLFTRSAFAAPGRPELEARSPGIVNALSLRPGVMLAQDPSGPTVNGRDVFRAATEQALGAVGVRVRWVDAWSWLHIKGGEIHCGTNALRDVSSLAGWYRDGAAR